MTIPKVHLEALCGQWEHVLYLKSNGVGTDWLALSNGENSTSGADLHALQQWFHEAKGEWIFGYLGYDLKNQLEKLSSENEDRLGFEDYCFFVPDVLVQIELGEIKVLKGQLDEINPSAKDTKAVQVEGPNWRVSKDDYLNQISKIQGLLQQGEFYEMNYCHEFYFEPASIDPVHLYHEVNHRTNAPFSTFLKNNHLYAMGGSPERYLKKRGSRVYSQPIKGTAPRGEDTIEDQRNIHELRNNPKERSENIMIVDLVRNDLSKIAEKNSVEVTELCEIYTFESVHQMISTVEATCKKNLDPLEVLLSCFPMGSMTGAPKVRVMEWIEKLEVTKRGLYSGSIGYFTPEGDFDFNVVIRTLQYNEQKNYLSGMVGGAITISSNPEKEWEETQIKARPLIQAVSACID